MEKDFESKLTLKNEPESTTTTKEPNNTITTNSTTTTQFFFFSSENSSSDFIEVQIKNSARSKSSNWEAEDSKVSFWLPTLDKYCSFVAQDAACRIDRTLLEKHYDSKTKTLTLPTISNIFFENFIFEILGALNFSNEFYGKLALFKFYADADKVFKIEKENSFLNYLLRNIEVLQENLKPNDTPKLKALLEQMGIFIEKNIFDVIEKKILNERKILIALAAGNNLWFKSEKSLIAGSVSYHLKLNNYSYIYINKAFVEKFFLRIGQHPRCCVGIVSSMTKKNLEKIISTVKAEDYGCSVLNMPIEYLFDQEANEAYDCEGAKGAALKAFRRCLGKISEKTKNCFDATNTLFVESEADKAEKIKDNLLPLNCFSEEILLKSEEEREKISKNADDLLDYLEKLLNECDGDVREYLVRNPFNKF